MVMIKAISAGDEITMVVNDKDSSNDECNIGESTSKIGDNNMLPTLNDGDRDSNTGPVDVAAAAAIISKKRKFHSFEKNPSIRRRQEKRLLKQLNQIIAELSVRVGQQAVVLIITPSKSKTKCNIFGAKPLEDVVKKLRYSIMEDLESALARNEPVVDNPSLFELPPLNFNGVPTPVDHMVQSQLRSFIPTILKYSTGRGKPGWGNASKKPIWWPNCLPWDNVRMDKRTDDERRNITWTNALRQVVINCYKYHDREDLLMIQQANPMTTLNANMAVNTNPENLQTITNPDGSISIMTVDSNNTFTTLPDSRYTMQVQSLPTLFQGQEIPVQTHSQAGVVDLNDVTEATLSQNGQLILTTEDGRVGGVIETPFSFSTYQTLAQIQQKNNVTTTMQVSNDGAYDATNINDSVKIEIRELREI